MTILVLGGQFIKRGVGKGGSYIGIVRCVSGMPSVVGLIENAVIFYMLILVYSTLLIFTFSLCFCGYLTLQLLYLFIYFILKFFKDSD